MSNSKVFICVMFGSAFLMFLAQSLEYAGAGYMTTAGALASAAVVGAVSLTFLAARSFRNANTLNVMLATCGIACLPFIVEWLLRLNDTELYSHGIAIVGYFFYGLVLEITAISLLISLVVRTLIYRKKQGAAFAVKMVSHGGDKQD